MGKHDKQSVNTPTTILNLTSNAMEAITDYLDLQSILNLSKANPDLAKITFQAIQNKRPWFQIEVSKLYTQILRNDGRVIVFGYNDNGKLGLKFDTTSDSNARFYRTPRLIPALYNVKQIVRDSYNTSFLLDDGRVLQCGKYVGQNINDDDAITEIPEPIAGLTNVDKIYSYDGSQYFLLKNGCVMSRYFGQKCYMKAYQSSEMTKLPNLSNVKKIISNNSGATFFILHNGNVMSFGDNSHGRLGLNSIDSYIKEPKLIPGVSGVKDIFLMKDSTYFHLDDGTVMCCGANEKGQLGLGDTVDRSIPAKIQVLTDVSKICTVADDNTIHPYLFFHLKNGNVLVCGENIDVHLGLVEEMQKHVNSIPICSIPTLVPGVSNIEKVIIGDSCERLPTYFIDKEGSVWVCGRSWITLSKNEQSFSRAPGKIPNIPKVKSIIDQNGIIIFIFKDGRVGFRPVASIWNKRLNYEYNVQHEIQMFDDLTEIEEVIVNENNVLFLRRNGQIYGAGENSHGQLGLGDRRLCSKPELLTHLEELRSKIAPNQLPLSKSINQLRAAIHELHAYGEQLSQVKKDKKGLSVCKLANTALTKVNEFFPETNKFGTAITEENIKKFISELTNIINDKNSGIDHYRFQLNTVFKNILIALTVVGLIAIGVKLIHSKVHDKRFLFFFQSKKTTSELKRNGVLRSLNKISVASR